MPKRDDLQLDPTVLLPVVTASETQQREQQRRSGELMYAISDMLDSGKFGWAADTLESIYKAIDEGSYASEKQERAINNSRRATRVGGGVKVMTTTMVGITWKLKQTDIPSRLSAGGRQKFLRGFNDRPYDRAYQRTTLNPYRLRVWRKTWAAGYAFAKAQEPYDDHEQIGT